MWINNCSKGKVGLKNKTICWQSIVSMNKGFTGCIKSNGQIISCLITLTSTFTIQTTVEWNLMGILSAIMKILEVFIYVNNIISSPFCFSHDSSLISSLIHVYHRLSKMRGSRETISYDHNVIVCILQSFVF